MNLEVTSEGENLRVRRLVFVGAGQGPYDAFGNLVGNGDHDLRIDVSPDLARVARAATSARATWQFGASERVFGEAVSLRLEPAVPLDVGSYRFTFEIITDA